MGQPSPDIATAVRLAPRQSPCVGGGVAVFMGDQQPSFPSFKTGYDHLCEDLGGPAALNSSIRETDLRRACAAYPQHLILPVLSKFKPDDKDLARRLWPWAALAIQLYPSEQKERSKYTDEPTPKEVKELLLQIAQSAKALNSGLNRLQNISNRMRDPGAPHRRAHLVSLDTFISQAVAGIPSNDVTQDPHELVRLQTAREDFTARLAIIGTTANQASKRVDRSLLDRERGQTVPGLSNFVFRCGEIWENLTGRKPSANKVTRAGSEDRDFVVFVQDLAKVGQAPVPTRRQVEKSLR